MSDTTLIISGREYVSPDCCSFSDYGGAGSVRLANVRVLKERAEDQYGYNDFYRAADNESRAYDSEETTAIRALCASDTPPPVFYLTDDYGSETVFLLVGDESNDETIAALADYPCIDEEEVSRVEMEWEDEAWESWLRADLERAAFGEEEPAGYDTLSADDIWIAYRTAMDDCNEYPTPEYNGVYVDVARIVDTFRAIIVDRLNCTGPNEPA